MSEPEATAAAEQIAEKLFAAKDQRVCTYRYDSFGPVPHWMTREEFVAEVRRILINHV